MDISIPADRVELAAWVDAFTLIKRTDKAGLTQALERLRAVTGMDRMEFRLR